jgi:ribosomal-protein-alanine N-acetyltransferase
MDIDRETSGVEKAQPAREVSLRPFVWSDLPLVLKIEQASFPSPWKSEFFLKELCNPYGRFLVAEQEGQVIGYICTWLVADEGQILNVAVHPDHRQRGVGRLLVRETLAETCQRRARSVSLEVRKSNLPAITLYEKLGFREVAVRRGYYENGEDALLMVYVFPDSANRGKKDLGD